MENKQLKRGGGAHDEKEFYGESIDKLRKAWNISGIL